MTPYILAYDIGTSGCKTCLYAVEKTLRLAAGAHEGYGLTILPDGGAEQDPEEWWGALRKTTARVLEEAQVPPEAVKGLSFCSQMQGLVLVDREGRALRPAMSYMDQRAGEQKRRAARGSLLTVQGMGLFKLLTSMRINGGAALSVKDPLWKYKWVEEREPEVFRRVHKWLDVKEYLIARCTGRTVMTEDSAFATFLYDTRRGRKGWSRRLCRLFGVNPAHLPELVRAVDAVGPLTARAAEDLGLTPACQVFGGGGDASLIGVGAGACLPGDAHIYSGTSGWVSTLVSRRLIDIRHMIASVPGVQEGLYNYFGELETSGKCLEWVKDHLALDAINIYMDKTSIDQDPESLYTNLYDYMCDVIKEIPPGSGGVLFTPWLHGNRCPFEDSAARGMFFNISLETGKRAMIRAVLEGVAFHTAWMLEASRGKTGEPREIRFAGGGALSPLTCQILADITGRPLSVIENPQNAGAMGAAVCAAIGMGEIPGFDAVKAYIPLKATYRPDAAAREIYKRQEAVFRRLYKSNRRNFHDLNRWA